MYESPPIWLYGGAVFYALAASFTVYRLCLRQQPAALLNLILILLGFLCQSFGLWALGMQAGSCPIRNPFEILHFISWSILVLYWLTGSIFRVSLLGVTSANLAGLLTWVALLFPTEALNKPIFGGNPWIEAHAAIALLSYGAFGLLSVSGGLYLLQNYSLKKKSLPGVFRFLPSLKDLDRLLFRQLIISLTLYSIALAIGAMYFKNSWDTAPTFKILFALLVWLGYATALLLRLKNTLKGRKLAITSLALFGLALFSLWPVEEGRYQTTKIWQN